MKKLILSLILLPAYLLLTSMCGFFAPRIQETHMQSSLVNRASQVILVRSGNQTVVTMQSDFQGDAKDFALIVPVPEVPREQDIRVAGMGVFDKLNAYSSARLTQYFDTSPCENNWHSGAVRTLSESTDSNIPTSMPAAGPDVGVTVQARYQVGEYEIVILDAKASAGLEIWLKGNGYAIPEGAKEALDPYVKEGLKFFVVKVNLDKVAKQEAINLSPIQVTYRSDKFMLPIRLGMANAAGSQDMILHAFSDQGRIELTNYRIVQMTTGRSIPEFAAQEFDAFYEKAFTQTWEKAGKGIGILEYSKDMSGYQVVNTIQSTRAPMTYPDLRDAGVFWLQPYPHQSNLYRGNLHMTRLRFRYDRRHFPQDLQLQVTPNKVHFQVLYTIQKANFDNYFCEGGMAYLEQVKARRTQELTNYTSLTGLISNDAMRGYMEEINSVYTSEKYRRRHPKRRSIVPPKGQSIIPVESGFLGWLILIPCCLAIHFSKQSEIL